MIEYYICTVKMSNNDYHFKGFIKQTVIKQCLPFPSFIFLIERSASERFFSFLTKVFVKSGKFITFFIISFY